MKRRYYFFYIVVIILMMLGIRTEAEAKTKSTIMYVKSDVEVRKKPILKAKKIGKIYALDSVKTTGTENGWTKIQYKGKTRYVKRKYLTKKKPRYVTKSAPRNSFKSYESYRPLRYSQGRLQRRAYTDKNGLRKVGNRYCIAMGSYYTTRIGCKIDLLMSDGEVVKCILADQKSDRHTDSLHQKHRSDGSLVEFVVDKHKLTRKVKRYGDVSKLSQFKRSVHKVRVYL